MGDQYALRVPLTYMKEKCSMMMLSGLLLHPGRGAKY